MRAELKLCAGALLFAAPLLVTCLNATSEATFISGRPEVICDSVYPVCKGKFAGCTLDEDHYLTGTFPGTRKFLVETPPGDWRIRVLVFLGDRLSPGTETEIIWYEPGCADSYPYQISKDKLSGDLFQQAGDTQVFSKERPIVEPGDHLIEVYSDATCRYDLRIEIVKRQ
jgi:hypothetical protein